MRIRRKTVKASAKTSRTRRPSVGRIFALFLAGTATAVACTWSLITDHSVRFNGFRSGRGFYRLPPLPIMFDRETGKEITVNDMNETEFLPDDGLGGYGESSPADPAAAEIWEKARAAIAREDLGEAQTLLQKFLTLTAVRTIEEDPNRQKRRNSARDMLDALTARKQGSTVKAVKNYLDARLTIDADAGQPAFESFVGHADPNLQDNWEYLRAVALVKSEKGDTALHDFRKFAAAYPHSEKNEAALYMAAKLEMEQSYSFGAEGCGAMGKDFYGQPVDPAKIEPTDKCRDEHWHSAIGAFQQLMHKYPRGRYFTDTRGWLAYLYRRGGERAKALAEYYRLLGNPTDMDARLEAKKSLQMIGHEYDDATLDDLEKLIAGEPDTAMAYAYHRIYNCATDGTYAKAWGYLETEEDQKEKVRVADARRAGEHELDRVARFATAMMKLYPNARVGGGFVLRVAEAQLESQNYPQALSLAKKALSLGVVGELRSQALWVKGSAEHHDKNLKDARATFGQLITEFPQARPTEGARRLLAMTAEDQGDLEGALEQYLALNYDYDVAYYSDVLLPTDRLAKFVAAHENIPQHNELLYALGVRYMRDSRWTEAREVLSRVRTEFAPRTQDFQSTDDVEQQVVFAKEPDWDCEHSHTIKTSWLMQDLKTIDVMEHLEHAVEIAEGDEAKAEAMYQLASYQFDANSLLFYNPNAWQGMRSDLLSGLDMSDRVRLPNESRIIFDHSQSHETLARAIAIYIETAERFPQTRAAKDALYSAAVAHQHLSNLNSYWRNIYESGLFAGPRMVTYAEVKSTYPRYQMPKGTNGWEASTRQVNGGPGWAPAPKPLPKLTPGQKVERFFKRLTNDIDASLKPRAEAAEARLEAILRFGFYGLLLLVGMFAFGYFALLGIFYRKFPAPVPLGELAPTADELPKSESRVDMVIGGG